jgi:two-component system nitrate/nitrite response regulator NarL
VGRNTIVREGLQLILSEHGFQVTSSATAAGLVPPTSATWILILLVEENAAELVSRSLVALKERYPSARIMLLATEFDFRMVRSAFRAGAAGCLLEELSCDRLVGMLHLVAMGEKVFPSQLADQLMDGAGVNQQNGLSPTIDSAHLSVREVEILRCLIMGLPNKVISRRLSISEATVKVHVKAVLRKLHVMNRTQAAIWATSRGLRGFDSDERVTSLPVQTEFGNLAIVDTESLQTA